MKSRFKLLIIVLIIISIIIAIDGFTSHRKIRLIDIVSYTSSDEVYNVSFQMIGEPDWPFGATTARVKVINNKNHKNIKDFTVQVYDDGANLRNENCHVGWTDDSVIITLTGSEQNDDVYIVPLSV